MVGLYPTGRLVSRPAYLGGEDMCHLLTLCLASSMIATGLSWRMAIGALVLGNAIMGMVITINGRIGARVSSSV